MAKVLGRKDYYCKGKMGFMYITDADKGIWAKGNFVFMVGINEELIRRCLES